MARSRNEIGLGWIPDSEDSTELEPGILQAVEELATSKRPIADDDKFLVDLALNEPLDLLAEIADKRPTRSET